MKKRSAKKWWKILIGIVVAIVIVVWAFQFNLGTKLKYTFSSSGTYYIYIPTNLTEKEAEAATVTLNNTTGLFNTVVEAEYWEENSCFHAVVSQKGIYEIVLDSPDINARTHYIEVGEAEVYYLTFNVANNN